MMTRKEKFKLKRLQLRKFNGLRKKLTSYFENEMRKQEGSKVNVSKRNLRWFVDIAKEGQENDK